MSLGARLFVAILFVALGASFIATTAALVFEFRDFDWFAISAFYSHLFIFFPTVGLLALCAFFVPAAVFTELYWRHVKWGVPRFIFGTLVLAAISMLLTRVILSGAVPAVWELRPDTLAADQGNPRGCIEPRLIGANTSEGTGTTATAQVPRAHQCKRVPAMDALLAVRQVSEQRTGLSPFVRDCKPDPFVEPSADTAVKRFCFASKSFASASECCAAQTLLSKDLHDMFVSEEGNHSLTAKLHRTLLPLKVFFLLVVLTIGILLAVWRREVDKHFPLHAARIERGVLIGAFAMLLWPVMNHAFIQAATVLYGGYADSPYAKLSPIFSFVFGLWALLLILFFFRQHERDLEAAGKIFGGVASVIAVMKYNQIIDYSVRFVGSGSDIWEVLALCALLLVAFIALVWSAATPETPGARGAGAVAAANGTVPGGTDRSADEIMAEERGGPT